MKNKPETNGEPTSAFELISPARADEVLAKHYQRVEAGEFKPRRVEQRVVDKYANDILSGNWLVNNQGAGFDTDGNLIDGQHRYLAIKKAGRTVKMLVARNLPVTAGASGIMTMDTIDTGRPRSFSQQLGLHGQKCAGRIASITRALVFMATGSYGLRFSMAQGFGIVSLLRRDMEAICNQVSTYNQLSRCGGASFLGPVVLYRAATDVNAEAFVDDYCNMVRLEKGSPVIALKRHLANLKSKSSEMNFVNGIKGTCAALRAYEQRRPAVNLTQQDSAVAWLRSEAADVTDRIRKVMGRE